MFPFTVSGSVRFKTGGRSNAETAKAVVQRIADLLAAADASSVAVDGRHVHFTIAFARMTGSWNVLVPFNEGTFDVESEIDQVTVRYDLSTRRLLSIVTAMIGAMAVFAVVISHAKMPGGVYGLAAGWLWLFGMNYLTAMVRMPRWLRRGLADLPELENRGA